ncbi:Suppressor of SWI4 1-like [Papilio machaon]|uniref:Suppressor of SWI4 1-like n=1 Tax=Papilio machaon TaxID=76193 RepID=A0A0N1I9M2_PAPMA|nr:Suppressor of SWI4 1-like [Papilio machaon]
MDGEVLYHELIEKTEEEKAFIKKKREEKRRLKEKRKAQQDENVKRKQHEKEELKQKALEGIKKKKELTENQSGRFHNNNICWLYEWALTSEIPRPHKRQASSGSNYKYSPMSVVTEV